MAINYNKNLSFAPERNFAIYYIYGSFSTIAVAYIVYFDFITSVQNKIKAKVSHQTPGSTRSFFVKIVSIAFIEHNLLYSKKRMTKAFTFRLLKTSYPIKFLDI